MTNKNLPPARYDQNVGFIKGMIHQGRLVWELLLDSRVPLWLKLIPAGSLAYLLFPLDLIADPIIGLGQIDDLAAIMLGLKVFIEMTPRNIVDEHMRKIAGLPEDYQVEGSAEGVTAAGPMNSGDVIEGDYVEEKDA